MKNFLVRYERHLSVAAMMLGFVADNIGLRRVDLLPETLLLYAYLAIIGLSILLIHLGEEGIWKSASAERVRPWLPLVLQFTFGSLFSAFLIFYSRSASLAQSWPFLFLLLLIFIGTEIFKKYQDRLVFQMAMYFFGIFSFCIFSVPLWFNRIGTNIFLLSGVVSIFAFGIFFIFLLVIGPKRSKQSAKRIIISAGVIYVVINALYFTHLLPPIPLTLKDIGVYHAVIRTPSGYRFSAETYSWFQKLQGETVHVNKGAPLYVFSSVFTPVDIRTNLIHRWEYWNQEKNVWQTLNLVRFAVVGGRDGGYRGFSLKRDLSEGLWRVNVETPDGLLVGRVVFRVVFVPEEPPLVETDSQ